MIYFLGLVSQYCLRVIINRHLSDLQLPLTNQRPGMQSWANQRTRDLERGLQSGIGSGQIQYPMKSHLRAYIGVFT